MFKQRLAKHWTTSYDIAEVNPEEALAALFWLVKPLPTLILRQTREINADRGVDNLGVLWAACYGRANTKNNHKNNWCLPETDGVGYSIRNEVGLSFRESSWRTWGFF